jgi:hypothetical protein
MSLERIGVHRKPNPTRCRTIVEFPHLPLAMQGPEANVPGDARGMHVDILRVSAQHALIASCLAALAAPTAAH